MNPWGALDIFVDVVESGGFSKAAEKRGCSSAQVSKRIAALESTLGVRLLARTTRRITLTEEGRLFYAQCKKSFDEFQEVRQVLRSRQQEATGVLKITLAGSFQERFLVPILAEFVQMNPKLQISLNFTDALPDLLEAGVDLAICQCELQSSSMVARRIANNYEVICAAPAYLAAHGTPRTLEDLKEHNCLVGVDPVWVLGDGNRTQQVRIHGNWHSPSGAALLSAARCGLGLARLPLFSVAEDIAAGTLVPVLEEWNKHPEPVWLVYPNQRQLPARVRLFIDFLMPRLLQVDMNIPPELASPWEAEDVSLGR